MTIDTLAYAKELEAAGVARQAAEAHAIALTRHVLPDLATKADLDRAIERLENRIDHAVEQSEHRLTGRVFGMVLGIVGVMNAILFALLRVVH
jgi:hypothetical protein